MDEKRLEIRTNLKTFPDSLKSVVIKYPGYAPIHATTCDINSEGMAFISIGELTEKLENGKDIAVWFNCLNKDLKGKTIYSYPIVESRQRIGVLFKNKNDIMEYNKVLSNSEH